MTETSSLLKTFHLIGVRELNSWGHFDLTPRCGDNASRVARELHHFTNSCNLRISAERTKNTHKPLHHTHKPCLQSNCTRNPSSPPNQRLQPPAPSQPPIRSLNSSKLLRAWQSSSYKLQSTYPHSRVKTTNMRALDPLQIPTRLPSRCRSENSCSRITRR